MLMVIQATWLPPPDRTREATLISVSQDHDGTVVVSPTGELCIASVPDLRDLLDAVAARGHRHVVVDLRGVTLLTAAGLGTLVAARERLRSDGGWLQVRNPRGIVERVLRICRLEEVLVAVPAPTRPLARFDSSAPAQCCRTILPSWSPASRRSRALG